MRIGVLADSHIPEAGPDLPRAAYEVFEGCDQILHCGDLHSLDVLDRLESFAPVLASRGNGDTLTPAARRPGVPEDTRVADRIILDHEGLRIGVIHDLEDAEGLDDGAAGQLVAGRLGTQVDIAICGHTHVPMLWGLTTGTMLLNPGSPTMPYGYVDIPGTVGVVDLAGGRFRVEVIDLRTGEVQLDATGPGPATYRRGPRPA